MESTQTIDVETNEEIRCVEPQDLSLLQASNRTPEVRSTTTATTAKGMHRTYSSSSSSLSSSSGFRMSLMNGHGAASVPTKLFGQRSLRSSEQRSKMAKDENNNNLKRTNMASSIVQVKKWERRLVAIGESSLMLYRWVPIIVNKDST